jgi:transcription antitermination factor NusG
MRPELGSVRVLCAWSCANWFWLVGLGAKMDKEWNWYALWTYARAEQTVDRSLKSRGFRTFFPHTSNWVVGTSNTKSKLVVSPYFSQYLFVGFRDSEQKRFDLVSTAPGVRNLVRAASGEPFSMPWPVMRELMRKTDGSGLICKGEEQIRPRFEVKIGDRIRIGENAAFFGLLAEVTKIDKTGKLVTELEACGRVVRVSLNAANVAEIIPKNQVVA